MRPERQSPALLHRWRVPEKQRTGQQLPQRQLVQLRLLRDHHDGRSSYGRHERGRGPSDGQRLFRPLPRAQRPEQTCLDLPQRVLWHVQGPQLLSAPADCAAVATSAVAIATSTVAAALATTTVAVATTALATATLAFTTPALTTAISTSAVTIPTAAVTAAAVAFAATPFTPATVAAALATTTVATTTVATATITATALPSQSSNHPNPADASTYPT